MQALLGVESERATVDQLLQRAEHWGALCFVRDRRRQPRYDNRGVRYDGTGARYDPATPGEIDSWHTHDALLAPITTPDGLVVGLLSCDRPSSGRLPTPEQCVLLELLAMETAMIIGAITPADSLTTAQPDLPAVVAITDDKLEIVAADVSFGTLRQGPTEMAGDLAELRDNLMAGRARYGFRDHTMVLPSGERQAARSRLMIVTSARATKRLLLVTWPLKLHTGHGEDGLAPAIPPPTSATPPASATSAASSTATTSDARSTAPERPTLVEIVGQAIRAHTSAPPAPSSHLGLLLFELVDPAAQPLDAAQPSNAAQPLDAAIVAESRSRLLSTLRQDDTLHDDGAGRFTVLCPALSRRERVETVARRLIDAITERALPDRAGRTCSAHIGIAVSGPNDPPRSASELLTQAEHALDQARSIGPGTWWCDEPIDRRQRRPQ